MLTQAIIAALAFGLMGLVSAIAVLSRGFGGQPDGTSLPAIAGVAALISGGLLWGWFACDPTKPASRVRGGFVGGLIGLAAHPLFWLISFMLNYAADGAVQGALDALWGTVIFSFYSWLVAGWVTVPVGVVTGVLLAAIYSKRAGADRQSPP